MGRFTSPVKAGGFNGSQWWWTTWEVAFNAHTLAHGKWSNQKACQHTHTAIRPWSHPSVCGRTSGLWIFLQVNTLTNMILHTKMERAQERESKYMFMYACALVHVWVNLYIPPTLNYSPADIFFFHFFYPLSVLLSKTKVTIMGI